MQPKQSDEASLLDLSAALAREPSSGVFSAVEGFVKSQLEAVSARSLNTPKDDREVLLGRIGAYQALVFAFRQARKAAESPEAVRATYQKK